MLHRTPLPTVELFETQCPKWLGKQMPLLEFGLVLGLAFHILIFIQNVNRKPGVPSMTFFPVLCSRFAIQK